MPSPSRLQPWLHDLDAVADRLRHGLAGPLPGVPAQALMAPRPRDGWRPAGVPADARQAAALVFLYAGADDRTTTLVLTVRAADLLRHGGQVSLPGGAADPGESVEQAALREAHEEIGLDPAAVAVLGRLTPLHIPVSGFVLTPVIGVGPRPATFHMDVREVARVLEVPLVGLADPSTVRLRTRTHEGRQYEVPYFAVLGEQVWGATAMILSELLALIGTPPVAAS